MDVEKHPDVNLEWEFDEPFKGEHKGLKSISKIFGPAFIAAIAYVDPGNFATNTQGGAKYGYTLLWVGAAASLIGIIVQMLSMKLGLATGKDLPSLSREHLPRWASYGLWAQAELIAMATDLAEFVGAAIALNMLFGVQLWIAGLMTGVVSFVILWINEHDRRRYEVTMAAVLLLILCGFLYDLLDVSPDWGAAARGFAPGFAGGGSVLLACGILGATVMPHVIYLHSEVAKNRAVRDNKARRKTLRWLRLDVVIAMTVAGAVNVLMIVIAAALFHGSGLNVTSLEGAHAGFERLLGHGAATAFALTLLVSGLASSSVGTHAGQVIMEGFTEWSISKWLRRFVTMVPALVVLVFGLNPTRSLVISQVILSFGIAFALSPLVWLTNKPEVMGELVNWRTTTVLGVVLVVAIVALNGFLLWNTFGL